MAARNKERAWFRDVRKRARFVERPNFPGMVCPVHHADVKAVLSDENAFAPYWSAGFRDIAALNPNLSARFHAMLEDHERTLFINFSGQRHREIRALFSRTFTPRNVHQMRPYVASITRDLLAAMEPGDDFVQAVSREVPSRTLAELMGIPEADRAHYIALVDGFGQMMNAPRLLDFSTEKGDEVVGFYEGLVDYGAELIRHRRAHPADDLVSRLANDTECPLDDRTLAITLGVFVWVGNDTTRLALAQMVLVLSEHPEIWDQVAQQPAMAEQVVEELLRFAPSALGTFRRVTRPITFGGAVWPADQVISIALLTANDDEAVFGEESLTFLPDRQQAREHLSFGHGPHYCIGANLARAELQEVLKTLTATITCPRVCGHVEMSSAFFGPVALPVSFERRT